MERIISINFFFFKFLNLMSNFPLKSIGGVFFITPKPIKGFFWNLSLTKKKKNPRKKKKFSFGVFYSTSDLCPEYLSDYKPFSVKRRLEGFLKAKKESKVLSKYLQGDFNNHNQHLTDCSTQGKGNIPHEHIHCFIEEIKQDSDQKQVFLARYFFPSPFPKPFRVRIYVIYPCEFSTKEKTVTKMEIIRNTENPKNPKKNIKDLLMGKTQSVFTSVISLPHCMIFWKQRNGGNIRGKPFLIFQGFMENQGCTILTISSLSFLHVNDNLILSPHSFWVNDRGFKEEGILLYGNKEGISFQMERMQPGNFFHYSFGNLNPKRFLK